MIAYKNARSFVEIDMKNIRNNYQIYKSLQPDDREIMAVVKADAYGHGDKEVTALLSSVGVKNFAVSNIDEAISIRKCTDGQILVLGYTPPDMADELYKNDITQALLSEEYAESILKTGVPVKCQFAIDTGMRRIGLNADNPDKCEEIIRKYSKKLNIDGLFTHLCVADTPEGDEFTKSQIELFKKVCERVADLKLPYFHFMNSAAGLWHKGNSCFVRLGIVLYGLKPDYLNTLPDGIKPALSWKSVVSQVKEVNPGDTVGYGRTYKANNKIKVATIPTGYGDGYPLLLSNKGYVLINGKRAPIIGRVCMDQMMTDVTDIPGVVMGTEVVLIGNSGNETITADDLAHLYGTIGYEVVCGINKRVERIYRNQNFRK